MGAIDLVVVQFSPMTKASIESQVCSAVILRKTGPGKRYCSDFPISGSRWTCLVGSGVEQNPLEFAQVESRLHHNLAKQLQQSRVRRTCSGRQGPQAVPAHPDQRIAAKDDWQWWRRSVDSSHGSAIGRNWPEVFRFW
ncbi:MAG: hypothetical protein CM15mP130_1640 [Verrucomicrobiota bacterium]|nr:MAG: hypothetical protein CM15mP130_1640 [Verrucomicrobiota bacterium]